LDIPDDRWPDIAGRKDLLDILLWKADDRGNNVEIFSIVPLV
jgi:hypothetical protein